MSVLIEKQGGIPLIRSLQGTVFVAEKEIEADLRRFVQSGADWVILTTGIGTQTLLEQAEVLGIRSQVEDRFKEARVAARGYKTFSNLKKLGISPTAVDDDGTTKGLIRALERFDFQGRRVVVQLHGEPAPRLIRFLEDSGADVMQILPYKHIPPKESAVQLLCEEIMQGSVDAVCFTAAIQVRFLFEYAVQKGCSEEIAASFEDKVVAVAVGKVTEELLEEHGVRRIITPEIERMGAMVIELSRYFEKKGDR